MPRRKRVATGGYVFHVPNRATARRRIFDMVALVLHHAEPLALGSLAETRGGQRSVRVTLL